MTARDARGKLLHIYRSIYFPPFVVFAVMVGIIYWSWQANITALNRDVDTTITNRTVSVQENISRRLNSYEQILIGGAGLFRASNDVTHDEWHNYVGTFQITTKLPGVQSIGYAKAATSDQLPSIVAYMQSQGFSNFSIKPTGVRDRYAVVLYIEPESLEANGVGIDLMSEPSRQHAIQSAADGSQTTITPALKPLLNTRDTTVFLMFVPQYAAGPLPTTKEAREQGTVGYVFAGFRAPDFFTNLFPDVQNTSTMQFMIRNSGESGTVLYQTADYQKVQNRKTYRRVDRDMHLYGQTWHITYMFDKASLATAQRRNAPFWTWVAGLLFAYLLADVIYLLLKARSSQLNREKDQAVDLAKDELLSLASHQLRTPATTVKQYLGMVLQGFAGKVTPTQLALLEKAYAGNERQLYTINEMLHVAKIDSGRITLAKHKTDLNQIVKNAVEEQRPQADAMNHSLSLKLTKQPLIISVDDHMMAMAIENLISNAIKYTLPGGKIDVQVQRVKNSVTVSVHDTGIGIDRSDVPKLYKLFTRLDNRLTQSVSGTGVGLYLAKHLVKLHRGRISVDSEPGTGSTFTIHLPYKPHKS